MSAGNKRGGAALASQANKQLSRQQLQEATLIISPPRLLMTLQPLRLKTSPSPCLTLEQAPHVDSSPLLQLAGMSALSQIPPSRLLDPALRWMRSSSGWLCSSDLA